MKILFDQGTPAPLRRLLHQHEISTAFELGWSGLKNGELLDAAERFAFDLLITTDANLRYQQNLTIRRIAIIVLLSASWPRIQTAISSVEIAVQRATPGSYEEIDIPYLS